jgi:DNA invertase Pin-like site-specific DNA recombinase
MNTLGPLPVTAMIAFYKRAIYEWYLQERRRRTAIGVKEGLKRARLASREIGEKPSFALSKRAVRQYKGVRPRKVDIEKVAALRAQGLSFRAIAKAIGVSRNTVLRRLSLNLSHKSL